MKKKLSFNSQNSFLASWAKSLLLCDQWSTHKVKKVMTLPATKKIDSLFLFPKKVVSKWQKEAR